VVDYAPILQDALIDLEAEATQPFSFMIPATTFEDFDEADTMAYTAKRIDGSELPGWLSFDPITCTFSGTPDHDDAGLIEVKVTATDSAGVSASDSFTITVKDEGHDLFLDVLYWNGGEGIDGVTSVMTENVTGIASDANSLGGGQYCSSNLVEGEYTVTAEKALTESDRETIDANDALAALDLVIGDADGLSYQYLAADIDRDGTVGFRDTLGILKMALGRDDAPEPEWAIVPADTVNEPWDSSNVNWPEENIAVTLNEDTQIDLVGVLLGDVDGSWGSGK
jgi:hypothetical protein